MVKSKNFRTRLLGFGLLAGMLISDTYNSTLGGRKCFDFALFRLLTSPHVICSISHSCSPMGEVPGIFKF